MEQRKIEGTGEALFQIIQNEKKQLIAQRKIKQGKKTPEITADEVPFEIPNNWKWVRWGELSESIQYGVNAPAKEVGRIRMVRISDIQDGKVQWETVPFCDVSEESIADYLLKRNDILFARTGGTVGKSYIVKELPEEAVYAGYLIRTRYSDHLEPMYLKYFMESDLYWSQLRSGTIATAQPNCNGQTLSKMILPLPPLEEQKRIVAKIEELMPFVEQYAKASTRLNTLNASFPDQMKKSILQQAVMGKLVPQDPNDEPASVLLKKIAEEKQKRIKEGKLKLDKKATSIFNREGHWYELIGKKEVCVDDILPFDIPNNWSWERFGNIVINRDAERIPLSVAEREKLDKKYDYYGASGVIDKVDRPLFTETLILIGEDGANLLSRSTPIAFLAHGEYWVNNHAHVIDTCAGLSKEYIALYINAVDLSPYVTGTAQPKMNQEKMNSILVAVPPKNEQTRIVKKYKQMIPTIRKLCTEDNQKKLKDFF